MMDYFLSSSQPVAHLHSPRLIPRPSLPLHHLPPPLSLYPASSLLSNSQGKYLLGEGKAGRSADLHERLFRLQGEKEGEDEVMG